MLKIPITQNYLNKIIKIKEDDLFIYVSFPYHPDLVEKAKSIFPHKYIIAEKCWLYPALIREEVYEKFGLYCPPKPSEANFVIDKPFPPYLYNYQIECLKLMRQYPKFGLYLSMGLGKTLICVIFLKYKKCKTLIVAPLSTLEPVWKYHFKKFAPELKVYNLHPIPKRLRKTLIKHDDGIHIINYEGFRIHFDDIINAGYKCLIIDESSKLKSFKHFSKKSEKERKSSSGGAQVAQKLIKMAQQTESVYLLSGNPCPNSKLEFFAQAHAIAPGLLGWNYYQFRNRYFYKKGKWEWVEKKETQKELINRLKKIAIFIKKEDVLDDLPEKIFVEREVEMSKEQWKYYDELRNYLRVQIGDVEILTPTILQQIMKLRQITSGFVYSKDKKSIVFSNTKFKALEEVLEEIPQQYQVVIWCFFREEIKVLNKLLDSSVAIYGETSVEERNKILNEFLNNKYRFLIAHPASLGHGINLTNCSYAIYYSLDWSAELWSQSQDRIHRIGQKRNCTYISLLCKDTIDEIIYARLQKKIEGSREILEHLKIPIKKKKFKKEVKK